MSEENLRGLDPSELGARLQEARKSCGLTQQDAADHLGVARTTVTAIEKGTRNVQPDELIRLAALYRRSVSELKRVRPVAESFVVQFRALLKEEDQISSPFAQALEDFRRLCDNYLYLENVCSYVRDRTGTPQYSVKELPAERAGESVARAERNRLGLGDGPVPHLRLLLEEELAMMVFYTNLPSRVSGMFAYTQSHGGCIAVNRTHPQDRSLWSLAHEYGHYLTNRYHPDVVLADEPPPTSRSERVADAFAKHFLLPAESVNRRCDMVYQSQSAKVTPADVVTMAGYFGVSFKAMMLRLEELRRVPAASWQRLIDRGFKVNEAKSLLDLARNDDPLEEFPQRYRLLALKAYADGSITENQLAELLNQDRLGAREEVSRMLQAMGVEDLDELSDLLSGSQP